MFPDLNTKYGRHMLHAIKGISMGNNTVYIYRSAIYKQKKLDKIRVAQSLVFYVMFAKKLEWKWRICQRDNNQDNY